jgi:hypothetical protein
MEFVCLLNVKITVLWDTYSLWERYGRFGVSCWTTNRQAVKPISELFTASFSETSIEYISNHSTLHLRRLRWSYWPPREPQTSLPEALNNSPRSVRAHSVIHFRLGHDRFLARHFLQAYHSAVQSALLVASLNKAITIAMLMSAKCLVGVVLLTAEFCQKAQSEPYWASLHDGSVNNASRSHKSLPHLSGILFWCCFPHELPAVTCHLHGATATTQKYDTFDDDII